MNLSQTKKGRRLLLRLRFVLISRILAKELFLAAFAYASISIFFLFQLLTTAGDVAQQDWGMPVTLTSALNDLYSLFFVWQYNGYGGTAYFFGWFLTALNAALAYAGLTGGNEIKALSVSLVALAGTTAYSLGRSFRLRRLSSFLSGLFYMTTPMVFNWLLFGWTIYIIAYDFLPLTILAAKRFLRTNELRYALVGGILTSIAFEQPAFLLVYPLAVLLFAVFEWRAHPKAILRAFVFILVSLLIWLLSFLYFFNSFFNAATLSFYKGAFFGVLEAQYSHLLFLTNPIRLWGSNYNYQFETYFPSSLVPLSFLPVIIGSLALLSKPRDRRILFLSVAYLLAFLAYEVYNNLHFLVFNLPLGSLFEAPSVFLVPASLGLALLIGYGNEVMSGLGGGTSRARTARLRRYAVPSLILVSVIMGGIPWWTGQTSGNQLAGPPTKLNLYQIPPGYFEWSNHVITDNEHFVLYLPYLSGGTGNVQIANTTYFSGTYQGVNSAIYFRINDLPYVSVSNTSLIMKDVLNGSAQLAERWGSSGIKYIVVYTNLIAPYKMSDLLKTLSMQRGLVKVVALPHVVVYQDEYAKPLVTADNAVTRITYHDPTSYLVQATCTTPFLLTLDQTFSDEWQALVNGSVVPPRDHLSISNSLGVPVNGWQIRQCGHLEINLYYTPQAGYIASLTTSIGGLLAIVAFVVLAQVRDTLSSSKRRRTGVTPIPDSRET